MLSAILEWIGRRLAVAASHFLAYNPPLDFRWFAHISAPSPGASSQSSDVTFRLSYGKMPTDKALGWRLARFLVITRSTATTSEHQGVAGNQTPFYCVTPGAHLCRP